MLGKGLQPYNEAPTKKGRNSLNMEFFVIDDILCNCTYRLLISQDAIVIAHILLIDLDA